MVKQINLIGQNLGKLTVLDYLDVKSHDSWFKCKCDCGNIIEKRSSALRNGVALHCGCSPKLMIDVVGKIFGKLTVLERINGHSYKCKCDCGRIFIGMAYKIRKGIQQSCGCLFYYHNNRLEALVHRVLMTYQKDAKKRNLEFNLIEQEFENLILDKCYYCGMEWSNTLKDHKKESEMKELHYNGIDRLDNTKGYIKENVVSCCKLCNHFKWILPTEEFFNWIDLVYENFVTKNRRFILSKMPIYTSTVRSMFRRLYSVNQNKSKERDLEWTLTLEQYLTLIMQPCYYCGTIGYSQLKHRRGIIYERYNGIDRVDNNKGYNIDNVVPACIRCNSAKKDHTLNEFKEQIIKIYEHLHKNNIILELQL